MQARRQAAFTLIELLVVIAIIGLLAAVLVAVTGGVFTKAESGVAKQQVAALETAVSSFEAENGYYPDDSAETGAEAPRDAPLELYKALMMHGAQQLAKWDPKYIAVFRDGDAAHQKQSGPVTDAQLRDEGVHKVFLDPWMRPYHYVEWSSREDYEEVTVPLGNDTAEDKRDPAANPIIRKLPGASYYIWSNGPNGINENGAGDDISSWKQ